LFWGGLGDVDRAQYVGAADALNRGRIVDAAGNVFELFVANGFWLVGFFAHIRWWLWVGWFRFEIAAFANSFLGPGLGDVNRAQHVGAANALDGGRIVDAAGNIFELLVANGFWLVGFFAHIGQLLGCWFCLVEKSESQTITGDPEYSARWLED
jgi:hypothetical protein